MIFLDFFKGFPWYPQENKPMQLPVLKKNSDNHYYIELLHKQLSLKGADLKKLSSDIDNDNFGDATFSEVLRFQQTHLGPDKEPLDTDGIVGPDTWWALYDESSQKLNLPIVDTEINSNLRASVLKVIENEHSIGTKEIPKGSNWGDGVTKYLKFVNLGPNPWCLAFVQWASFQGLKTLPWKSKTALVSAFWNICKKLGFAYTIKEYSPIPGDLFVMIHDNGTGHIGFVTNVNSKTNATEINTIEGNSGDRVAKRLRKVGANDHIGYINMYGDAKNKPNFTVGLSRNTENEELNKTR